MSLPMQSTTHLAIASPTRGWRMRLKPTEAGWEVRVLIIAGNSISQLRRYPHRSLEDAVQDLVHRFR